MSTLTIRIEKSDHDLLAGVAKAEGTSMKAVISSLVDDLRRRRLIGEINEGYAGHDVSASANVTRERHAWESTLTDGLGA